MKSKAQRRAEQLGMSHGAAVHRLRKNLLFRYVSLVGDNECYKCGRVISTVDEFTIEHKQPWENRDTELFWNIDNIAFSHAKCNIPNTRYRTPVDSDGRIRCYRCKEFKEITQFYKNSRRMSGLSAECKDCNTEMRRELRRK